MYIFRNRQCSGYFSVLKRYNDICNHVEILHCSVKEMQLQFSKKKPTRIGMQFLFYESLYAVGIIANFNKNIRESLLFNAFDMKAICEMGFKLW